MKIPIKYQGIRGTGFDGGPQSASPDFETAPLDQTRTEDAIPEDALLLDAYSSSVTAAVEKASPSVVNIEVRQQAGQHHGGRPGRSEAPAPGSS